MTTEAEPRTSAAIGGMGHSVKRKEDPRFIRGKGEYIDDVNLPGQLWLDIVRSPYAHARIKSIDASEALRLVAHEIRHFARGIEFVEVDRGMHETVVERRQVAGQFERARGAHRVADVALRVVDARALAVAEDGPQRFALLLIAERRRRRVRAHDVDVERKGLRRSGARPRRSHPA